VIGLATFSRGRMETFHPCICDCGIQTGSLTKDIN
jgi:hypothetical protein